MPGLCKHFGNAQLASFAIRAGITQPGRNRKPAAAVVYIFKGEFLFSHYVLSALYGDIKFVSIHKINSFLEVK